MKKFFLCFLVVVVVGCSPAASCWPGRYERVGIYTEISRCVR